MYLLNITNIDYVMMTILFGAIFASAYYFRRKNRSSNDFLLGASTNWITYFSGAIGLGIIEFILLSSYGAYAGLSGLLLFILIYIISEFIFAGKLRDSNLFSLLKDGRFDSGSVVIITAYAIIMLLVAGTGIAIMVSMLKSLLGWEFANSTLSLIAIAAVCLILGGYAGLAYSKVLASAIQLLLLFVVIVISYKNIGFGNLLTNLQSVATDNKLATNVFTSIPAMPNLGLQVWLLIIGSLVFVVINPFAYVERNLNQNVGLSFTTKIIRLALVLIVILSGIFALATPNKLPEISGKKIVTTQTRFDNGELGYVVRAVPGSAATLQRGIIPVKAAEDDDQTLNNSAQGNFDYISAALVVVKKALPFAFVPLFVIVLFFFKSVSDSVLFATLAIINGLYAPRFNKSGEDLENLWAARVFMFALFVIAICIGLVLFKFFSFYYMFALLVISAMPIACSLLINKSSNWLIDLIIYILIVFLLLVANVSGAPSLLPLIKYANLSDMVAKVTLSIGVIYFLLRFISGLLVKKTND